MRKSFCLLIFIIHFTEGCDASDKVKQVTGYTGGSVLLPCACKHSQSEPKTFNWRYFNKQPNNWIEVFKDEKYKNRLKMFNQNSPANLSLLISDLRKEDEGLYRCEVTKTQTYKDFRVTIKGCDLDQNKQTVQVTGHTGGSVVLPCSCTELQAKPQHLKWTFTPLNHRTKPAEIHPKDQSKQHTGRVKLLNDISPGNLSLHISNLKKEDQGEYHCSELQQHINITLSVQDLILLSVFPVLLLMTVLALIYWKSRGRRNVQQMTNDGLDLVCSENEKTGNTNPDSLTQGQNLKQDENEDEVTYSSVLHVKTTAKPQTRTIMTEYSEYASIK